MCMYLRTYVRICVVVPLGNPLSAYVRIYVHMYIPLLCLMQGSLPPLLATCLVDEMDAPLHLSISGQVEGMAVRYELVEEGGQGQPTQQGQTADTSEE